MKDGDTIKLGDTTLKLYLTPGHTPGVTSIEFPVFDGGKQYKAFMNQLQVNAEKKLEDEKKAGRP